MMPTAAEITAAARQGFESAFAEKRFYDRQTSDDVHLKAILDFLPVRPRMKILDLGAGTGYLTFALAKRYPGSSVTGADIAANTLGKNRERAAAENIGNISFAECDGITLPERRFWKYPGFCRIKDICSSRIRRRTKMIQSVL